MPVHGTVCALISRNSHFVVSIAKDAALVRLVKEVARFAPTRFAHARRALQVAAASLAPTVQVQHAPWLHSRNPPAFGAGESSAELRRGSSVLPACAGSAYAVRPSLDDTSGEC